MNDQISPARRALYYIGIVMFLVGIFLIPLIILLFYRGSLSGFMDSVGPEGAVLHAVGGMILMVVGRFLSKIGSHGLAGSGVVLDPKRARKDLEPYSRMGGGMLGDAIDESGLLENLKNANDQKSPVVMIRCRDCDKLNEEDSKFCQECGKRI